MSEFQVYITALIGLLTTIGTAFVWLLIWLERQQKKVTDDTKGYIKELKEAYEEKSQTIDSVEDLRKSFDRSLDKIASSLLALESATKSLQTTTMADLADICCRIEMCERRLDSIRLALQVQLSQPAAAVLQEQNPPEAT